MVERALTLTITGLAIIAGGTWLAHHLHGILPF